MFGQDFTEFGETHEIVGRLEDKKLWRGAVRVRWMDRGTVIINECQRRMTLFVSQRGHVEVVLVDPSQAADRPGSSAATKEEIHEYWFDDPRALLVSQKDRQDHLAELRRVAQLEHLEPTKFVTLPLLACDFVRFIDPTTGEAVLAVADTLSQGIKVLDRDGWRIAGEIASLSTGAIISGIDVIRLNNDATVFCTCDAQSNSVHIINLDGICLMTTGSEGPRNGEFRHPCAIAARSVSPSPANSETPSWFVGDIDHKSELEQHLYDKKDVSEGDFCMGRRVDDASLYDLVYMGKGSRVFSLVVRRVPRGERPSDQDAGGVFLSTSGGRGPLFKSIWHFVLAQKYLRKPSDMRPFAYIAVADLDNARVQILRYFWTNTEFFIPSLEHYITIGGIRKRFFPLLAPSDVSFSPTGELAICDVDKVVILAPTMAVVKVLRQAYSPLLLTREQRDHRAAEAKEQNHEAAVKKEKMKRGEKMEGAKKEEEKMKMKMKQADNTSVHVDDNVSWPLWAAPAASAVDKTEPRPCSVSFATDGKLAIGYKSGGVLIYKAYKSLSAGSLNSLPSKTFEDVLGFCSFDALAALRNCCRALHHFTRDLRAQWRLPPMRAEHHNIVVYYFLRWATKNNSELAFCTRHIFAGLCKHRLETGSCPLNKSCPFSHDSILPLGFYAFYPPAQVLGLERSLFLTCCTSVFGANFCWQQEKFIAALFDEYAAVVPRLQLQSKRARYTPGGEVLRDLKVEDTKVLGIKEYLNIMTCLEEDRCGSKRIETHALFHRTSKKHCSGPYAMNAIDGRIYLDPLKQYDGGLKVPCIKLKERQVKLRSGMEDQKRGVGLDLKALHIESVRNQTERVADLTSRIFK